MESINSFFQENVLFFTIGVPIVGGIINGVFSFFRALHRNQMLQSNREIAQQLNMIANVLAMQGATTVVDDDDGDDVASAEVSRIVRAAHPVVVHTRFSASIEAIFGGILALVVLGVAMYAVANTSLGN